MEINIRNNNVTGAQHSGAETRPSFDGEERLIEIDWHRTGRWLVRARASGADSWSAWIGDEGDLDELMALARDVATGG